MPDIAQISSLPVGAIPHAWVAAGLYFEAVVVCFMAARRSENHLLSMRGLALCALLALAFNRGFRITAIVMAWVRDIATTGDWYDQRRWVQGIVAVLVAMACVIGLGLARRRLRTRRPALRWAAIGLIMLIGVQLLRGLSLHHLEWILAWSVGGFRISWLVECGGLGLVTIAAWSVIRRPGGCPQYLQPAQPCLGQGG